MKTFLERAIAVGDTWVAALVRQSLHGHATAHFLSVSADKCPVALLIRRGDQCAVFTPAGETMAEAEVERLCPGATAQFMRGHSPLDG
jgi:hypothetical protein